MPAPVAAQAATAPGTRISNTASVSWTTDGVTRRADSNTVTITVEDPGDTGATLVKTQSVRAPDGSARAVTGAVITYTLAARLPAGSAAARIDDPVPPGTIYLPGTLTLDGSPLSDAADGDAGRLENAAVVVTLDVSQPNATRTVTFQVRLP